MGYATAIIWQEEILPQCSISGATLYREASTIIICNFARWLRCNRLFGMAMVAFFIEQKQMTVEELTNIFLRLDMAGKAEASEFLFESGTINFTVNSIYEDAQGCVCLESNEIMELDDYPVGMIVEELSHCSKETGIYFYDDDSKEYYGIYPDEIRTDGNGDLWIKVR